MFSTGSSLGCRARLRFSARAKIGFLTLERQIGCYGYCNGGKFILRLRAAAGRPAGGWSREAARRLRWLKGPVFGNSCDQYKGFLQAAQVVRRAAVASAIIADNSGLRFTTLGNPERDETPFPHPRSLSRWEREVKALLPPGEGLG